MITGGFVSSNVRMALSHVHAMGNNGNLAIGEWGRGSAWCAVRARRVCSRCLWLGNFSPKDGPTGRGHLPTRNLNTPV